MASHTLNPRPFAGLSCERELVALRELLPAASMTLRLNKEHGGREVVVASVLPALWPALHRKDGTLMVGMQATVPGGDLSRAFAAALLEAAELEAGQAVTHLQIPDDAPTLQEILDDSAPVELTVHETFDFWLDGEGERTEDMSAALQEANDTIMPSRAVAGLEHAYWVDAGSKEHLRWVRSEDEERVVDAIARLHARRESGIGEGTRFVGMFRAEGLTIPVWDLPKGFGADGVSAVADELRERFEAALACEDDLTVMERRARGGIVARQVTLR
ncbi:DUF5926 family protein [Dermabacteraceae bacterium P13115]